MKLTLVGAGGFRTPAIYRALLEHTGPASFDEVVLHDLDAARLERIEAVLADIDGECGRTIPHVTTADLRAAVEGADVVYCAVRVGGLESRLIDERVAVDHGVIGQETTGPGGLAFAFRTVPVVTAIAETVAAHAPGAQFINFTNPAGLVTEAARRVLGDRVVGICDAPPDLCRRVAGAVGRPAEDLWFDYFGINHLGWVRAVTHRGVDLLPELLADDERLLTFEEGRLFGGEWLRAVGMLPNEYLYYYYFAHEALAAMRAGPLRAEYLIEQQRRFYDDGRAPLELWRATTAAREASYMGEAWTARGVDMREVAAGREPGGYGGIALRIVDALFGGEPAVMVLNTANRSSLPFLDEDAVVEVPCVVGPGGVVPVAVGDVPMEAKGLIEQVRASERAAIDAALTGSRRSALRALALHPLVPSVAVATELLDAYTAQHPTLQGRFR
jgi:6-phospho-beta-glucosidase